MPTVSFQGHPHPLIELQLPREYLRCCLCFGYIDLNDVILRCVDCSYIVHKSCTELPQQIRHVFPSPTLGNLIIILVAMLARVPAFATPSAVGCAISDCTLVALSLYPAIRCDGHEHLLTLFENFPTKSEYEHHACNSCNAYFEGRFLFRCVEWDVNLHIHCHPSLPLVIKHEYHIDPSTFRHSVVQEDNDSNEFYCDTCEKGDPELPVYHCEECDFVAHVNCVFSEVLNLLTAEQDSDMGAKEADIKPASIVEGSLSATAGVEVMARGVITQLAAAAKLDEEIAELQVDKERMTAKLEAIMEKLEALKVICARCVASKMLSAKDECLSEASTLEEETMGVGML
ncbi:hypothetical protein L1049_003926 [Liquidambar formosana]|uniref:DC1 domain-containing protein n=1 Tax=Liquidambar formosana TaxID=63359 RepID=A0AAP0WV85_LIQFO